MAADRDVRGAANRHAERLIGEPRGSLTVVGTGIELPGQLTLEAREALTRADDVLYLVADPVAAAWLERLCPSARAFAYETGRPRREIYELIVEEILSCVRTGRSVCAAFYGHPGVFVDPAHEAIERARSEGFEARMLPGISAEDCLFADLGINPGRTGCQSYEATDFLVNRRRVDTSAALILWQITVIGEQRAVERPSREGIRILVERLLADYRPQHEVTIYQASPYPVADPIVRPLPLAALPDAELPGLATLYVPSARRARRDRAMLARLRLPSER